MKSAMRPRYYCDHCNKGSGNPSFMKRHERGCTANPARVCGMCRMHADDGGPAPAPSRDELVRIMNADGFKAMCAAANDCPACILSVIRQFTVGPDEDGPGGVAGPRDGRQEWTYAAAKKQWWDNWNSAKAIEEPGY